MSVLQKAFTQRPVSLPVSTHKPHCSALVWNHAFTVSTQWVRPDVSLFFVFCAETNEFHHPKYGCHAVIGQGSCSNSSPPYRST